MAQTNDEFYSEFVVLYALGRLDPDVAADFENVLQKRPDLAEQVERIRLMDDIMSRHMSMQDISDKLKDYTDEDFKDYEFEDEGYDDEFEDKSVISEEAPDVQKPVDKPKPTYSHRRIIGIAAMLAVVVVVALLYSAMIKKPGSPIQVAQNNNDNGEAEPTKPEDNGGGNNPLKNNHSGGNGLSLAEPGPAPAVSLPGNVDDDINLPSQSQEEIVGNEDFFKEDIDSQPKSAGVDSTNPNPPDESSYLRDYIVNNVLQNIPENKEALLATFTKESQDNQEVKTAVSKFYKLLDDFTNPKVEDFESISETLTPEIIGNDKELESFKARIDEIVKKVKEGPEKK